MKKLGKGYIVVQLSGGQGFLPEEAKKSQIAAQSLAQDILDRYGNTEYFDDEAVEYYEIPSFWVRLKLWWWARPF